LLNAGEQADAITHVAAALQRQPDSAAGRELMSRAIGAPAATASVAPPVAPPDPSMSVDPGLPVEPTPPAERVLPPAIAPSGDGPSVDWRALEEELSDVVPPRFARADAEPDPIL